MFVLTNLEKSLKNTIKIFSRKFINMANYQDVRVKLTNKQLNKLKSAAKNKTGAMLRLN